MTGQQQPTEHFHQFRLAKRWQISPNTLERWRYLKIGGRVVYRIEDIEAFEEQQLVRCGPVPCKPIGLSRSNPWSLSDRA